MKLIPVNFYLFPIKSKILITTQHCFTFKNIVSKNLRILLGSLLFSSVKKFSTRLKLYQRKTFALLNSM